MRWLCKEDFTANELITTTLDIYFKCKSVNKLAIIRQTFWAKYQLKNPIPNKMKQGNN